MTTTKIFVGNKYDKTADFPEGSYVIDATSQSKTSSKFLSPFTLGPVIVEGAPLYTAQNVENAWQFSKVYLEHLTDGGITKAWWEWAEAGWSSPTAHRYPMGKGRKPVGAYYDGDLLNYYHSRIKIYIPTYRQAVAKHELWPQFKEFVMSQKNVVIADFDGYQTDASYDEVVQDLSKPMGHSFIVREMLLNGA